MGRVNESIKEIYGAYEEKFVQRILKAKGKEQEERLRAMLDDMRNKMIKICGHQLALGTSLIVNIILILILIFA